MTDIARLGVAMDTKQLRDGKAALDALVPSAQKAEKGIDKFNAAAHGLKTVAGGAATGVDRVRAAAAAAVAPTDRFGKAALGVGTAMKTVQVAVAGANAPINNLVGGLTRVAMATGEADAHIKAYRASLASVPAAANSASSSLARLGAAANDNINRLQSTPGNIAAQFQDIGVTAAGGMSPLLIALQQGTQLSAAMQGGIGNLFAGLRQLFNITTILTVGLVALIAAGLQMVDWMRVGEILVNALADALEQGAVAATYFGVVMAIAFAPQIIARIGAMSAGIGTTLVTSIGSATGAMIAFAAANPFTAVVLAIGLVIGAMYVLNDTFGGVFTDILKVVKTVANAIIRFFAIGFNTVIQRAESAANAIIRIFNGVSEALGFDVQVGKVDFSGAQIDTRAGRDFVGEAASFVSDAASRGAGLLRGLLTPDAVTAEAGGGAAGAGASRGQTEAERQAEAYLELTKRAQERINTLTDEAMALRMTEAAGAEFLAQQALLRDAASQGIVLDEKRTKALMDFGSAIADSQVVVEIEKQTRAYKDQINTLNQQSELIGLTGLELEYTRTRQELINDAINAGIIDVNNMTDAMRAYVATLGDRAFAIAQLSEANRSAEFTDDFTRGLDEQTAALMRQAGELGLTGAALTAYRIESDLLNDALRQGIELTPETIAGIRAQASAYANLNEQITEQQRRFDDARTALRGFFSDMVSGLQQGQSVWEVFGNAVLRIVNSIIDRLINNGTNSLLGSLSRLFGGGGGGLGRLLGDANSTIAANPGIFAKGGAFDRGGLQAFAKGGAFTNGVYSNPTLFKFANGGSFGVMGEAGPEAVMPLKRGSDGSLGVRVTAMEPQMVVVRVVTDDERFDAYVDDRITQSAPQVAQAGSVIRQREEAFLQSRRLA